MATRSKQNLAGVAVADAVNSKPNQQTSKPPGPRVSGCSFIGHPQTKPNQQTKRKPANQTQTVGGCMPANQQTSNQRTVEKRTGYPIP